MAIINDFAFGKDTFCFLVIKVNQDKIIYNSQP